MQLDDRVGSRDSVHERVDDDQVGDTCIDCAPQLFPPLYGDERVLRSQDDCEVRLELTGQESNDVHANPGRMS